MEFQIDRERFGGMVGGGRIETRGRREKSG